MSDQLNKMSASDTVTADDLTNQIGLLHADPQKYLELVERYIQQNPSDPHGYFARHQAWMRLDKPELALEDLNRELDLVVKESVFECRGEVHRYMGRYEEAVGDFNRAETLDREEWEGGFGLLFRADCQARLGNEAAALADCLRLPDNHWTPGHFNLPPGNKEEVADWLRRMAAWARGSSPRLRPDGREC